MPEVAAISESLGTAAARLKTAEDAVLRARAHARNVEQSLGRKGLRAMAYRMSDVVVGLGQVGQTFVAERTALTDSANQVAGVPADPSAEQVITALEPVAKELIDIPARVQVASAKVDGLQADVAAILKGATPGPLLAKLEHIKTPLPGVVAAVSEAAQQTHELIATARVAGGVGAATSSAQAEPAGGVTSEPVTGRTEAGASPHDDVVSVRSGRPGAWNSNLDDPAPETTYLVDERYTFTTDNERRTVLVEGQLARGSKERSLPRQRAAGGKDRRVELDDGGHLIANDFLGPSEAINLVAQLRTQNRSTVLDQANWYALERHWAKSLSNDPPETVEVSIAVRYPPGSARPSSFRVRYRIAGGDWQIRRFKNEPEVNDES